MHLEDIEENVVQGDIKRYLTNALSAVGRRRNLGEDWPRADDIDTLVEKSRGLFIYASTAVLYISQRNADPTTRIQQVIRSKDLPRLVSGNIDSMYALVLKSAFDSMDPDSEIPVAQRCLRAIACIRDPLSVQALADLLTRDVNPRSARFALSAMHSVIRVPDSDTAGAIASYHASFIDYITDPKRSGTEPWHVDTAAGHIDLYRSSLRVMNEELKFNISATQSSYLSYDERPPPPISPQLAYACSYWVDHLLDASREESRSEPPVVEKFLRDKLLYWLEGLTAIGRFRTAADLLTRLATWSRELVGIAFRAMNQLLTICIGF